MTDARSIALVVVVLASEVWAAWIIWKLWTSRETLILKIVGSAVALVPVLGPILVTFVYSLPPVQPSALQARAPFTMQLHDLWRDVLDDPKSGRRFNKLLNLLKRPPADY